MKQLIQRLIVAFAVAGALAGCAGFGHNGTPDPAIYIDGID